MKGSVPLPSQLPLMSKKPSTAMTQMKRIIPGTLTSSLDAEEESHQSVSSQGQPHLSKVSLLRLS